MSLSFKFQKVIYRRVFIQFDRFACLLVYFIDAYKLVSH